MTKKTILVIDGGGRGSTLVKKYLQSRSVKKVLAIPGNDLMLLDRSVEIFPETKTTDSKKILDLCKNYKVDLIDVAQDDAVAAGVADVLIKNRFKVFGPTKAAGQIEWDKSWSKNFMIKNGIPTAKYKTFKSEKDGISFINKQKDSKWYIKASGLAAGKGAIFAQNNKEAVGAIKEMKNFGSAGKTYIIEEFLDGEEFSSFAALNGKSFVLLGHAQDHKTVFDNNKGSNTGGMGCSSPPLVITGQIENQIKSIIQKTATGLLKLKRPYIGILYLGGIITKKNEVKVIEFNARWGDPEAQVVIPSIKNDYYDLVCKVLEDTPPKISKDNKYRIVVTAAAKGYPGDSSAQIGKEIKGFSKLLENKNVRVHGTRITVKENKYISGGSRLFYVEAAAKNVAQARKIAYNALSLVSIPGGNLHYRQDIGYRDLKR